MKLYPFYSLIGGAMFFSLGGGYWGGCYLAGASLFLAALVMPRVLAWSPLIFGVLSALVLLAIGLHLRKLGGEASDDHA